MDRGGPSNLNTQLNDKFWLLVEMLLNIDMNIDLNEYEQLPNDIVARAGLHAKHWYSD